MAKNKASVLSSLRSVPACFWITTLGGLFGLVALTSANTWNSTATIHAGETVTNVGLLLFLLTTYGAFVARRWDRNFHLPSGLIASTALICSVAMCMVGYFLSAPWVTSLGWIGVAGCALKTHRSEDGSESLLYFLPPLFSLATLPESIRGSLDSLAAQFLSMAVVPFLELTRVPFRYVTGSLQFAHGQLELGQYFFGPATSLTVFATLLLVAWYRRPILSIPFYIAAAILWSFAACVSKLVLMSTTVQGGLIGVSGIQFIAFSLVCVGVSFALILSTDRLLRVLLFQIPDANLIRKQNPLNKIWNRAFRQMSTAGERISEDGLPVAH